LGAGRWSQYPPVSDLSAGRRVHARGHYLSLAPQFESPTSKEGIMPDMENKQIFKIGGTALGQFFNEGAEVLGAMTGCWASTYGKVISQKQTETGLQLEMQHVFTTSSGGMVQTRDDVVLTAIPGREAMFAIEFTYNVVKASGQLEGFSGTFKSFGLVKMDEDKGVVRYEGQITKL
jgi:hypothetical protein